jgi:hypothetical protein
MLGLGAIFDLSHVLAVFGNQITGNLPVILAVFGGVLAFKVGLRLYHRMWNEGQDGRDDSW